MSSDCAKQCPGCGTSLSLNDLMHSTTIVPQGLQADPTDPDECYFQFAHNTPECNSSFLIHSTTVKQMCGQLPKDWPGEQCIQCQGYCAELHELASCNVPCSHHHFRQFLLSLWWTRNPTANSLPDISLLAEVEQTVK